VGAVEGLLPEHGRAEQGRAVGELVARLAKHGSNGWAAPGGVKVEGDLAY
jgi:hypothetical protein